MTVADEIHKDGQFPVLIDNRERAVEALDSGDPLHIKYALAQITYFERDWQWFQDQCLRFLHHEDHQVRALAAGKLGDIAIIHKQSEQKVIDALEVLLHDPVPEVAVSAEESIGSIRHYVPSLRENRFKRLWVKIVRRSG
ncbi:MAG: hypothetical protein JXJ17_18495 [Anaerolineae bacterium]|nr:hypothetical protein [Anaerolineae bacterium]